MTSEVLVEVPQVQIEDSLGRKGTHPGLPDGNAANSRRGPRKVSRLVLPWSDQARRRGHSTRVLLREES